MVWDNPEFNRSLAAAVDDYDRERTNEIIAEFVAHLASTDDAYPADDARRVLDLLRRKRYFGELERTADALIRSGQRAPAIRRLYAQALLDQGRIAAAVTTLETVLDDTESGSHEDIEARGLLGRASKQAYIDGGTAATERARGELLSAIAWYGGVYREDPEDPSRLWHGINTVALLVRAGKDGIEVPDAPDPEAMAADILGAIDLRRQDQIATMWDYGTALEACIALGEAESALEWAASYVQSPNGDAFEFASTLRHLEEVWRLSPDSDPGRGLLPMLRAAVLSHEGGSLDLDASTAGLDSMSELAEGGTYESILGAEAFEGVQWLHAALERANSVALVADAAGRAHGTAFVVRAGDCGVDEPEDELLLLTNAHVISVDEGAVFPSDARITFENEPDVTYRVDGDVIWSSPIIDLDATLIRTDPPLADYSPMPIAGTLPRLNSRVYIIGHPQGRPLSYSIYDNRLLNTPEPQLHYRTPTEGGSSGSPVFDRQWQLIGLHHKGSLRVSVPGKEGLQSSNEGIMFSAISAKASADGPATG